MPDHRLTLVVLPGTFAVCRLGVGDPPPAWAFAGPFAALTRTAEEISVVCPDDAVPEGTRCERGWRCLRVAGTLNLALLGVLASLLVPLAEAGVGVFAVSTFDTDYLLVRAADLGRAAEALRAAGHSVQLAQEAFPDDKEARGLKEEGGAGE
jgi:hypothetical protein